ncbi:hypothetical protein HZB00_01420 [Candidatus Woesearchaeota archaeon]|nr:hypothetical protein [Candidatus Woesearchaeota archaeon]
MPKQKQQKKIEHHAHENMHVLLQQPVQVRKEILGAAIEATQILKEQEELHLMESQYKKIWRLMETTMRDIKRATKQIEESGLPKISVELVKPARVVAPLQLQEIQPKKSKEEKLKPHSELDKLNNELAAIEERLNKL